MSHTRDLEWLVLGVMLLFFKTAFAQNNQTGFLKRDLKVNGEIYCYQVFVPHDVTRSK